MPRNSKKEKSAPNFVVFLVEGESDKIALETPLSEFVFEKHPDYEVRFLLQQKLVNTQSGDEIDDPEDDEDDSFADEEYVSGGDITASSFVTPENIEKKIEHRFITPATKAEGLYPKRIAKIIQIVDMDGAYIPGKAVIPLSPDRAACEKLYYDGERAVIETQNVEGIRDRNQRKQKNLDYLLSLTKQGIKIKSRTIPYEIYFFSSNLDHFIHNKANLEGSKKYYARCFMRQYGLDSDEFCRFFYDDPAAIGKMGYYESWGKIKEDANSVRRFTNIDCLIKKLQDEE